MRLVYENPAALGKSTRMAALPGVDLVHGQEVEVPAGLVGACLASGLFRAPDEAPGDAPAGVGKATAKRARRAARKG